MGREWAGRVSVRAKAMGASLSAVVGLQPREIAALPLRGKGQQPLISPALQPHHLAILDTLALQPEADRFTRMGQFPIRCFRNAEPGRACKQCPFNFFMGDDYEAWIGAAHDA